MSLVTIEMDETLAAEHLYTFIGAPKGTVNVCAMPDQEAGIVLKVWIAPGFRIENIPSSFEGFEVKVESRPRFKAGANA